MTDIVQIIKAPPDQINKVLLDSKLQVSDSHETNLLTLILAYVENSSLNERTLAIAKNDKFKSTLLSPSITLDDKLKTFISWVSPSPSSASTHLGSSIVASDQMEKEKYGNVDILQVFNSPVDAVNDVLKASGVLISERQMTNNKYILMLYSHNRLLNKRTDDIVRYPSFAQVFDTNEDKDKLLEYFGIESYKPPQKVNGYYFFPDHPEFKPNLSPEEMFRAGAFGGTYWRPIYSSVVKQHLENVHHRYAKYGWWRGLDEATFLTTPWESYNKKVNKWGVKVGQTLEEWEGSNWITQYHPYGWVHWYCDFFIGKRCPDDDRQIRRWIGVRGRFGNRLINMINKKSTTATDPKISPKIRQTLLHWAWEVTP